MIRQRTSICVTTAMMTTVSYKSLCCRIYSFLNEDKCTCLYKISPYSCINRNKIIYVSETNSSVLNTFYTSGSQPWSLRPTVQHSLVVSMPFSRSQIFQKPVKNSLQVCQRGQTSKICRIVFLEEQEWEPLGWSGECPGMALLEHHRIQLQLKDLMVVSMTLSQNEVSKRFLDL